MLPIRPEDYGDANWCPDCGEPRGVCCCDLVAKEEWLEDELSWHLFGADYEEDCDDLA